MHAFQRRFIDLAVAKEALAFGRFELKSGRISPYFFNAGRFCDGSSLAVLGHCYAAAIVQSGIDFDFLFGPAYKGIPLATATAIALAEQHGRDLPWCFNRKEAKDHGEGGVLVGAPARGRAAAPGNVELALRLRGRLARYHRDVDNAFWQWNDVWLSPAFAAFDIRDECKRIGAPLLAVQGEDDEYGTLEQLQAIARAAPQTRMQVLAACGHSPHRDQPEALTATIGDFLAPLA